MTYKDICVALGVEKNEEAEKAYVEAENAYVEAEKKGAFAKEFTYYDFSPFFPELCEILHAAEKEITENEPLKRYTLFLREVYDSGIDASIPFMAPEKEAIGKNLAPLFAISAFVPKAIEKMEEKGIPIEMQKKVLSAFPKAVEAFRETNGVPGIQSSFFFWARHYLTPDIFPIGSLEFELTHLPEGETVLLEKATGKLLHVRDFSEKKLTGKPVQRGGIEGSERVFSGELFGVEATEADTVLSVHIPKGADLSKAALCASFEEAKRFFKMYFPEKEIRGFYCRSWLMDPALSEILPEDAKIISFQNFFTRYPVKSTGKEIFVFILPEMPECAEDIPETTSLFRAVKKRYLKNDPIYVYAGVHKW